LAGNKNKHGGKYFWRMSYKKKREAGKKSLGQKVNKEAGESVGGSTSAKVDFPRRKTKKGDMCNRKLGNQGWGGPSVLHSSERTKLGETNNKF